MQAIMLAAGMGSRLGKYTKDNTKCMLDVYGKTLLERAIDSLLNANINKLILVLGYKKENVKKYIKDEYTIYEKIINLCDLMCTTKVLTIDKRGMDLLLRHGVYAKTHYHIKETYKLKAYFDDLLGYNLYDLFPEIKDNL